MKPSDSLYSTQWHFGLLGKIGTENLIERIWNEFTGKGVQVAIFDDGIETTHTDLDDNYVASLAPTINGVQLNGNHGTTGRHGTSVAGLIAAENNGAGAVGVAFNADLVSVNIFDPLSPVYVNSTDSAIRANFLSAIRQAAALDIVNNSWSQKPAFRVAQSAADATAFAAQTNAAYAELAATGRVGLGTLIVQAAGNDNLDANGDGLHASRFTITVGAVHQDGFASSYSNYGACLLVCAPGGDLSSVRNGLGIITTDKTGSSGYNLRGNITTASDFTNDFGGTSSAAPIVSSVIALMLEANPALGWRDIQNILALSASHTGSAIGSTAPGTQENNTWFFNKSDNWNGGGQHFSEDYGYGIVNAFAAVRMAEAWRLMDTAKTSANEVKISTGTLATAKVIADKVTTLQTFQVAQNISIESLSLTLNISHTYFTDLRIFLISPEGTEVQLYDGKSGSGSTADNGLTWTFGVEALRGELSAGTWTVKIIDMVTADTGTLNSLQLDLYGATPTANDIFTFTDEFFAMASLNAARRKLSDTDGGVDWINAAAMTGNLSLNLNAGAASTSGGQAFVTLASGTIIENAVTGDGNDVIYGNTANNAIHGMRGNDVIYGGAGNDTLYGGQGNDSLAGGSGANSLYGGDGIDSFHGSSGLDTLYGDGGALDIAYYAASSTGVVINLGTNVNNGGDAQGDKLFGIERVYGSTSNDQLTGDAQNNYLYGQSGNDTLNGGLGNDILLGGVGSDTFRFTDVRFGRDVISDFQDNLDRLSFSWALADSVSDFTISGNGTSSVVVSLAGQSVTVRGPGAITLDATDFLFSA